MFISLPGRGRVDLNSANAVVIRAIALEDGLAQALLSCGARCPANQH
jgi:hypothetical protein